MILIAYTLWTPFIHDHAVEISSSGHNWYSKPIVLLHIDLFGKESEPHSDLYYWKKQAYNTNLSYQFSFKEKVWNYFGVKSNHA